MGQIVQNNNGTIYTIALFRLSRMMLVDQCEKQKNDLSIHLRDQSLFMKRGSKREIEEDQVYFFI